MDEKEIFEWIPDFINKYKISNYGKVWSEHKQGYLKQRIRGGYLAVKLNKKDYPVHRLVALVFCKNDNNYPIVNHLDEDRINNHYTNLEWVSPSKNVKHSVKYKGKIQQIKD